MYKILLLLLFIINLNIFSLELTKRNFPWAQQSNDIICFNFPGYEEFFTVRTGSYITVNNDGIFPTDNFGLLKVPIEFYFHKKDTYRFAILWDIRYLKLDDKYYKHGCGDVRLWTRFPFFTWCFFQSRFEFGIKLPNADDIFSHTDAGQKAGIIGFGTDAADIFLRLNFKFSLNEKLYITSYHGLGILEDPIRYSQQNDLYLFSLFANYISTVDLELGIQGYWGPYNQDDSIEIVFQSEYFFIKQFGLTLKICYGILAQSNDFTVDFGLVYRN